MYYKLDDWKRAADNLRLSVQGKPDGTAYCNLALALWHAGDTEGCVEAYKLATAVSPNSAEGPYGLGWVFFNLERYPEAVAPLRTAIEIDRTHADAHYHLGMVLMELGQPQQGLRMLREAAKLRPEHPDTHYAIGVILAAEKDFEDAIASYREAVRLRPNFADAYYNIGVAYSELADIYEHMGNEEVARQLRSKADELKGNGIDPAIPNPKRAINKATTP